MMESLPWPAQLGVAAGGWALAASIAWVVVRAFMKGDIFPRRTVEALEVRNAKDQEANRELIATNKTLTESTALANAVMENLNRAAREVSE